MNVHADRTKTNGKTEAIAKSRNSRPFAFNEPKNVRWNLWRKCAFHHSTYQFHLPRSPISQWMNSKLHPLHSKYRISFETCSYASRIHVRYAILTKMPRKMCFLLIASAKTNTMLGACERMFRSTQYIKLLLCSTASLFSFSESVVIADSPNASFEGMRKVFACIICARSVSLVG